MSRTRIFLADDHALFREGLRALLERQPGVEVVGEAGEGTDALAQIAQTRPDVAVLDIGMPGLTGIEVTRRLRAVAPETRVLILSMYEDEEYLHEALDAGAAGYILKDHTSALLVTAVETLSHGGNYLCPTMAAKMVEGYARRQGQAVGGSESARLSPREREVLQLVAEGYTSAEIGGRLGISPKTVEVHRGHISAKLGIQGVPGLVKYAIRKGLIRA